MGNICTFSSKNGSTTNNKKVEFDSVVENISGDQTTSDQVQDQDHKELLEFVESNGHPVCFEKTSGFRLAPSCMGTADSTPHRMEVKPLLNIVSDTNIPRKSSRSDPPKKATTIELSRDSIVNSVITKFVERSNMGFKKYGKTLDRKDLTPKEWVQHMEEELMDAILYLEKLRTEISEYEMEEKNQTANDLKIAPSKQNPDVPMYKIPEEWDHFVSLHENNDTTV